MTYRLGKLPARHDPRTLRASLYMGMLPVPPVSADWSGTEGQLGMMANDQIGCCTVAAAAHAVQVWTGAATGTPVVISDADVVSAYEASSGYDPTKPGTDRGCGALTLLNYWRGNGLAETGHKIAAYALVNHLNHTEVMQTINLFGGMYVGAQLPINAQMQIGFLWDVLHNGDDAPGSWGGHAMYADSYDAQGVTLITWGKRQKCTWAWWDMYVDDPFAVISQDWIKADAQSPSGFDIATLQADLAKLT